MLTWSVICAVPKIDRTQKKKIEAFYIALMRPNLKKSGVTPIFSLFLEVVLPSSVIQ